jgi:4a-hydroxytetrahydrobiopterin dehydratase
VPDLDPDKLASTKVTPADASTPALSAEEIRRVMRGLDRRWRVVESHLVCEFDLPTFGAAFGLATRIALLAESQNHHPMMLVSWGRLEVSWSTDAISGLSGNDFVMAAKVDRLVSRGLGLKDG